MRPVQELNSLKNTMIEKIRQMETDPQMAALLPDKDGMVRDLRKKIEMLDAITQNYALIRYIVGEANKQEVIDWGKK